MEYQRHNRTKPLIVYNASYPVGDPLIFVVKYRKPLLIPYGQPMKELFIKLRRGQILLFRKWRWIGTMFI